MIVFAANVRRLVVGHGIGFRAGRWLIKSLDSCVLKAVDCLLVVVVDAGRCCAVMAGDALGYGKIGRFAGTRGLHIGMGAGQLEMESLTVFFLDGESPF